MQSGAFWWLLQASFVSIIMFPVYTLLYQCVHVEINVYIDRPVCPIKLYYIHFTSLQRVSFSV